MKKQSINWLFVLTMLLVFFSSCSSLRRSSGKERVVVEKNENIDAIGLGKEKKQLLQKKYAALLNLPHGEIKNVILFKLIDEWYGIPYKYGGKTKEGIDCSNFITLILKNVYNKNITANSTTLHQMCDSINTSDLKEGDLVFFKIEQEKISHLGFYLANGRFVHATSKKGIMINSLEETYYKKHFFSAGRLK